MIQEAKFNAALLFCAFFLHSLAVHISVCCVCVLYQDKCAKLFVSEFNMRIHVVCVCAVIFAQFRVFHTMIFFLPRLNQMFKEYEPFASEQI